MELGATDYILMPFSPREIVVKIKDHLKKVPDPRRGGVVKCFCFDMCKGWSSLRKREVFCVLAIISQRVNLN